MSAGDPQQARECEKCGSDEINMVYHGGSNYWGDVHHCANGAAARGRNHAHFHKPHLHLTCKTCGYDWTEATRKAARV